KRRRLCHDAQIGPLACRAQIAHSSAAAPAVPRRRLEVSGAFLERAVEIAVARDAGLLRRGDEGLAQLVRVALVGDGERTALPVEIVGPALVVLGLLEVGQHVVPTPADIAELAPMVEILLLAADVDAAIDRAG